MTAQAEADSIAAKARRAKDLVFHMPDRRWPAHMAIQFVAATKTGPVCQRVTERPGEFVDWYNSGIAENIGFGLYLGPKPKSVSG
jgi:hypothetical protein